MPRPFKSLKQRSIFFNFLLSYLLILIIPLFIGTMDYMRYSSIIKKESENYNLEMLQQAQSVLDEHLKSVEQLAMDISASQTIQNFITIQNNTDSADIMMMMDVLKEINKYTGMNPNVSEIYIYFAKSDVVLTTSAKYTPELYYEMMYSNSGLSYEEWKRILIERRYKEYSLLRSENMPSDGNSTIKLLRSLRTGPENLSQGTLVIAFKNDRLRDVLDKMNALGKGAVYILNSRNEIVAGSGESELIAEEPYERLVVGHYNHHIKSHGRDVVITSVSSKVNDWVYVSAKPMDILMQKVYATRNITLFIVLTGLLAGIVLAFLLSRRNATPIRMAVSRLKDNIETGGISFSSKNEIDYIETAAMTAIKEAKSIKAAMENQLPALQASMMVQLLKGNISDTVNLEHVLDSVGIRFAGPDFCVMVIDIEACEDESLRAEWSLIKFIVSNILLELGNEKNSAYILDLEWERMALLVNLQQDGTQFESTAHEIAVKVRDMMYEKFSTSISVGVGGVHRGIENIKESYRDAIKALEYKMFKGRRSICLSKDALMNCQSYEYSIETEIQLIKSVKYGDFDTVQKLIKEIFDQNLAGKSLSMEMARCFHFDIMSTGIKILSSINIEYKEVFGADINPLDRLTACNTIGEMHETLVYIYRKICEYISSIQVEPGNDEIVNKVLDYIEKRYSDPSISLAMVAEAFNMTPSNLSHIFKEHTGCNFIDWLREKRIGKIRELLADSNMSLEEIAQVTGYVNSNVLIRNFKKIENITPGQYRDIKGKLKLLDRK